MFELESMPKQNDLSRKWMNVNFNTLSECSGESFGYARGRINAPKPLQAASDEACPKPGGKIQYFFTCRDFVT